MFIDTPEHAVREWFGALIVMVSPHTDKEAGRGIFDTYIPGLAKRFPPRVFCPASAEAVAAECKRWPSYGVLVDLLRKWSTENPDRLSLRDQRSDSLKPADRAWVNYWHRRMTEGFSTQDGSPPANLDVARATCLSLIRSQSMPAFVEINGPDQTGEERIDGWHDRKALQRTLDRLDYDANGSPDPHKSRAMLLGCIRRMVTKAAPELLDMLPPVVAGEDREDRNAAPDMRMRTAYAASRPFHTREPSPDQIVRRRGDDLARLAALQERASNPAMGPEVRTACAETARTLHARLLGEGVAS